jgi:hypothetical protein
VRRLWPTGAAIIVILMIFAFDKTQVHSEDVEVKYRGKVNLAAFSCTDIARSSFINRVCYDTRNEYMLISLNGTFYHYCEIDNGTVSSLLSADSMGRFYNANIKGRFDCRTRRVPSY